MSTVYVKKPAILASLPLDRHAVIEASAGTGKTYTLEHLVIDLLLEGRDVTLDRLLVVTFTEKLTLEPARHLKPLTTLPQQASFAPSNTKFTISG